MHHNKHSGEDAILLWDGVFVLPVNTIVYSPRFLMDSFVVSHSVWQVKWLDAKNCGKTTLVSKNKHCYEAPTSQQSWSYLKSLLSAMELVSAGTHAHRIILAKKTDARTYKFRFSQGPIKSILHTDSDLAKGVSKPFYSRVVRHFGLLACSLAHLGLWAYGWNHEPGAS